LTVLYRSDAEGAVVIRTYDFDEKEEFPVIVMDRRLITTEVLELLNKLFELLRVDVGAHAQRVGQS
jgi:hypothetical protein